MCSAQLIPGRETTTNIDVSDIDPPCIPAMKGEAPEFLDGFAVSINRHHVCADMAMQTGQFQPAGRYDTGKRFHGLPVLIIKTETIP